jgi:hypothetical protein
MAKPAVMLNLIKTVAVLAISQWQDITASFLLTDSANRENTN